MKFRLIEEILDLLEESAKTDFRDKKTKGHRRNEGPTL